MAYPGFDRQSSPLGPMEFRQFFMDNKNDIGEWLQMSNSRTGNSSQAVAPGSGPASAPGSAAGPAAGGGPYEYSQTPVPGLTDVLGQMGSSAFSQAFQKYLDRNKEAEIERRSLLNRENDYQMWLSQVMAQDPTRYLKAYEDAVNRARKMGLATGSGVSWESGRPRSTGVEKYDPKRDPEMERLRQSYLNPGSSLLAEDPGGILRFQPPEMDQAVSKSLAGKGDMGKYVQGGVEKVFGTSGGTPRGGGGRGGGGGGGGFGGFLQQALPFGAAAAGSAVGLPPMLTGAIASAIPSIFGHRGIFGQKAGRHFSGAGSTPSHSPGTRDILDR